MEFYEVRCPCVKPHDIHGVEYSRCGTLLGGVEADSTTYFRCPTCGMVKVDSYNSVVYTILGKSKIKFNKSLRRIVDGEY